jgi:hypothetical protein
VATREQEGVEDLVRVLDGIGLRAIEVMKGVEVKKGSGHPPVDAVLKIGNRRLPVEVGRDIRDADARTLVDVMPPHSLVVADRFSPRARDLLADGGIGWLDRRGHLRLVLPPGIFIDRDIEPLIAEGRNGANPFTTVGLDVAIALLLDPNNPPGVREISRRTKNSAGRVSQLVHELRTLGLVNRDGTPAIPELFEAVVDAWKPQWIMLGRTPPPDPSLRLTGLQAAIWHGVALLVTEDWPPEIYVRDEFALRRLVRTYPVTLEQRIHPVARVAICPSPYGFDRARDENLEFPVVNHVVAALDLAQDQGRGREALDQWHPEGIARVW